MRERAVGANARGVDVAAIYVLEGGLTQQMTDGVAALVMADIHSSTPDIDWMKLAGEIHSAIAARKMVADACEAGNFTEDDEWALEQAHCRLWDLIGDISAQPALSFEGLRVKARAVSVAMDGA